MLQKSLSPATGQVYDEAQGIATASSDWLMAASESIQSLTSLATIATLVHSAGKIRVSTEGGKGGVCMQCVVCLREPGAQNIKFQRMRQ